MTPSQYNKLRENIKRTGKYPSLLVVEKGEKYLIIDGHNRCQVLKELGHEEAWCEIWEVDERQADLLLATLNELGGTNDTQKRMKLLSKLYQDFGEDKDLLLRLLPETERSLNALLKAAGEDLKDFEDQLEMDRGLMEEKLKGIMDPDEAANVANMYKHESNTMKLTFRFKDEINYAKAVRYFVSDGKKTDVKKLIDLIKDE